MNRETRLMVISFLIVLVLTVLWITSRGATP